MNPYKLIILFPLSIGELLLAAMIIHPLPSYSIAGVIAAILVGGLLIIMGSIGTVLPVIVLLGRLMERLLEWIRK